MSKIESAHSLSKKTGASWRSVVAWLEEAGKKASDPGAYELVKARHEKRPTSAGADPKPGLTWFQLKTKEEALARQRENRIADKIEKQEYMAASDVLELLSAFCNRLEQIPGKVKSELGLSDAHTKRIQKMLDEARADVSEKLCSARSTESDSRES